MRSLCLSILLAAGLGTAQAAGTTKEKDMNLPERFEKLAAEWAEHCRKTINSSRIDDYLDAPAYRGLIELGRPAVPLIMTRYTTDEVCPWEFVLEGITGVKFIENHDEIVWGEVQKKRLAWWEKEKAKK